MFAERKPQSPESAASGVRQDMFVDAMMWFRSAKQSEQKISALPKLLTYTQISNGSIDVDLVLPFEFGPHASELESR